MSWKQVKRNAPGKTANPKAPAPIADDVDAGKDGSEDDPLRGDNDSISANSGASENSLPNFLLERD